MGIDADLTIMYGATEQDVYHQLEPMLGDDTLVRPTETPISDTEKRHLMTLGYKVKQTPKGWYPTAPHHKAIIRGWTKTENEAWTFCQKHYQRDQKN